MAAQYVLPVGLHVEPAPHEELHEGYEVQWRDGDEPPHYFFYAQVSVLRLGRLLDETLARMPERCHAVLELRRPEAELDADPDAPSLDRFVSALVPREEVAGVLARFHFQILHDGRMGFGFYDPDSPLEVFVDDHKLLSLFSPSLEPFEALFARLGVPHVERLATVLEYDHEHHGLSDVPHRISSRRHGWLRRRKYEVDQVAKSIRRRLRMRLEPQPRGQAPADEE